MCFCCPCFATLLPSYPYTLPPSHIFSTYLLNRVVCWCCVDSCLDLGSGMMAMVNPLPLRKLPLCCCFHTYPLILLTTIQDKTIDTFPLRSTYSGENTNFYTKYFNSHSISPQCAKLKSGRGTRTTHKSEVFPIKLSGICKYNCSCRHVKTKSKCFSGEKSLKRTITINNNNNNKNNTSGLNC